MIPLPTLFSLLQHIFCKEFLWIEGLNGIAVHDIKDGIVTDLRVYFSAVIHLYKPCRGCRNTLLP